MGQGKSSPVVASKDLKDGDIILMRASIRTQMGSFDPGVLRAVAATQRSNYFSTQEQHLAGWTQCGLILSHKEKQYLAMATIKGIELFPAGKRIRKLQKDGAKVAVRKLQVPFTEAMHKLFADLLHAAVFGCEWERYLPEVRLDSEGRGVLASHPQTLRLPRGLSAAPSTPGWRTPTSTNRSLEGDTISPRGITAITTSEGAPGRDRASTPTGTGSSRSELTPFGRELIRLLVPRVWAALCSVPPQVEVELERAFLTADKNNDGRVSAGDVQGILQDFKGSAVSKPEADTFTRLMSISDPDAITFDDFVLALARRPLKEIPVEHDVGAILNAEFVATIYEMAGLLPLRETSTLRSSPSSVDGTRRGSTASATSTEPFAQLPAPSPTHAAHGIASSSSLLSPSSVLSAPSPSSSALVAWSPSTSTGGPASPRAFAAADHAEVALARQVTSSDVLAALRSPTSAAAAIMSRHARAGEFADSNHSLPFEDSKSDLEGSCDASPHTLIPSGYDGTVAPASGARRSVFDASGVEGIASPTRFGGPHVRSSASGAHGVGVSHSASASGGSSNGLPPLPHRRTSGPGSGTPTSLASALSPTGVVGHGRQSTSASGRPDSVASRRVHSVTAQGAVVIIASTGDFRHYLPMTFSSHHDPKLSLLRGRLDVEGVVDCSTEEAEAAHAKAMVRAVTAQLRSADMIVPPSHMRGDEPPGSTTSASGERRSGGSRSAGGGGGVVVRVVPS